MVTPRTFRASLAGFAAVWALASPSAGGALASSDLEAASGSEIYRAACAACHGAGGRGAPAHQVGFDEPLPDFTDCGFATREPDADWLAVSHQGGPTRAFSRMMPAFGEALDQDQMLRALSHVRSFCADRRWPRGELNLPLALFTEKAYPEDELVWRSAVAAEGRGEVANRLVFEKRLGARHQLEVIVPTVWRDRPAGSPAGPPAGSGGWAGGLGDAAIGVKSVVFHSLERGSIASVAGEIVLPTGDEDDGLGSGTTVFEPFVSFGQLLPADAFLQFQGGLELPLDSDLAEEAFWRLAVGRTWSRGGWGRHGQVLVYLLWDWFDGGFLEGW